MKPISITIENVRSFRAKRTIPFADMRLFAIIGDTGAGKTSVLEAMTYALYNRSTWSGRNVKELIAEGASFMAVSFEFAVGDDVYTISRRTSAGATQPEHRLRCDALNLDVSGDEPVREAIVTALGMNDKTFLQTVLLPQGQHTALLLATGKEKNEILADIFRLEEITDVDALAVLLGQAAAGLVRGFSTARKRFAEDMTDAIATAEADCENAAAALDEAAKIRDTAIDLAERARTLAAEKNTATARNRFVERLDQALLEMDELSEVGERLQREKAQATSALRAARDEHSDAEKSIAALRKKAADSTSLRNVEARVATLTREQEELEDQRARLKGLGRESSENAKRVPPLSAEVTRLQTALEAAARAEHEASDRNAKDRDALRLLEIAVAARDDVAERLGAAVKAVEKSLAEKTSVASQLEATENEVKSAAARRDEAAKALEGASTASLAAQIGEHLHAGEKCPVCRQKVPASYAAPSVGSDIRDARAAVTAAGRAYESRSSAHQQLVGAFDRLKREIENAKTTIKPLRERAAAAEKAVSELLEPGEKPAQTLQRFKAAMTKSAAVEPTLRAEREKVEKTLNHQRSEYTKLTTLAMRLASDVAEATTMVADREMRCAQLAKDIPKEFAQAIDPNTRQTALLSLASAIAKAVAAEEQLAQASSGVNDCAAALAEAERAFAETVLGRRGGIFEQMRAAAEALGLPPQPIAETQRFRWIDDTVRTAAVSERSACHATTEALTARGKALDEERLTLLGDPPVDPQELVTRRTREQAQVQTRLENARRDVEQASELERKIALMEPAQLGLDTLHRALGAREFLAYARERRQRRLLQQATLILKEMTGDRYEFSGTFEIIDRQTNGTRAAQALSGGEKFLASLALSLAVVEIAASAGAKIESLFIDEGFASLDSDSLEMAMLALRDRARHGRPIGVISHLREVGQYVDGTFRIEAGPEGSTFLYTDGPLEDETPVSLGLVSHVIGS
jgi:exonuclease SbcC